MFGFGRDQAQERQQIHEISINVGRRLLSVLDRGQQVPPMLASEIEAGVRLVSDIQGEVANLLASMPPPSPLDVATFTHIMGRLEQALGLLEFLEGRLAGIGLGSQPGRPRAQAPRPPDRRQSPAASGDWRRDRLAELATAASAGQPKAPAGRQDPKTKGGPRRPVQKGARPPAPGIGQQLAAARAFLAHPPVLGAIAIVIVLTGFALAVRPLLQNPRFGGGDTKAAALIGPGTKIDGRLEPSAERLDENAAPAAATPPAPDREETLAPLPPTMEQPYLVVLSTRETTEELLQDFRAFKEQYPTLLGAARARVDKVEGQDQKIWHRLSLIPPLAHDEAKALCGDLKAAGLAGCWIKPLPVSVAPPPVQ
jgi:hypothetical protein